MPLLKQKLGSNRLVNLIFLNVGIVILESLRRYTKNQDVCVRSAEGVPLSVSSEASL